MSRLARGDADLHFEDGLHRFAVDHKNPGQTLGTAATRMEAHMEAHRAEVAPKLAAMVEAWKKLPPYAPGTKFDLSSTGGNR